MTTRRVIATGITVAAFGGLTALAVSTRPGTPAEGATPVAAPARSTARTVVVHRTVHVPAGTTARNSTATTPVAPVPSAARATTPAVSDDHDSQDRDQRQSEAADDHGDDSSSDDEYDHRDD